LFFSCFSFFPFARNQEYVKKMRLAFGWFLGENDMGMSLYDERFYFPLAYLPSMIKAPETMARIAMIRERPSKFKWSNGISPVMMSQMPSRIIPKFFVSLNLLILLSSFLCHPHGKLVGKTGYFLFNWIA